MIGFAIVGCGTAGGLHARALCQVPGARLAALVTSHPDKGQALAAAVGFEGPVDTDLALALNRPDVDAVIVATPSGGHRDTALTAARAGKHVLVEKPLEITLDRCDEIIEACAREGVLLGTVFQLRFRRINVALKSALDAGQLGRLTLAEADCRWWRPASYYQEGAWRGTRGLDGGGALMNQGIHVVDLIRWLAGPVARVSALVGTLAHEGIEVEDTAVACLEFENGALGVLRAATSAWPGLPRTLSLHGNRGSLIVEEQALVRCELADEEAGRALLATHEACATQNGASDPAQVSVEDHRQQLSDFADAIQDGRLPLVTGEDGRQAVAIVRACYDSAALGKSVSVPE